MQGHALEPWLLCWQFSAHNGGIEIYKVSGLSGGHFGKKQKKNK